jgi:hypothetical protein
MNRDKISQQLADIVTMVPNAVASFLKNHLGNISAHSLGWVSIILLHMSTVPTLLSVLTGMSDKLPNVDIMLFVWAALTTIFLKSLIEKNYLYLATICVGFVGQTIFMGLILFK